jgi:hypothetical protein
MLHRLDLACLNSELTSVIMDVFQTFWGDSLNGGRSISRPRVDVIDTDGIRHPRTTSGVEIMIHALAFESRYIMDGNI